MMCALYIVCSKMELADKIGLREIMEGYKVEKGGCLSEEVVMDILYRVKGCGVGGEEGNIVTFYNVSVFVSVVVVILRLIIVLTSILCVVYIL